ncbi:DUF6492 family protein [Ahrensia kielensis]|uniref:DUF6492 family protein n=1 Tax=Ahrensia kielensis TaxID=76980 RepID=UPI00036B7EC2|nr:DUF6492 family protein [Ahrensia kielensis]
MTKTNAIITASYAPDFERCKILCESMDRYATGYECHYILVDVPDLALFKQLEGPKRKIITDKQLLPWWLYRVPKLLSPNGRRVWVSPLTVPLHGWHVQQIKRIAVAFLLTEDALLYCDSDTVFVKPFNVQDIWHGDALRLWREEKGALFAESDHLQWKAHAGRALSIPEAEQSEHNYVCTFLSWNRQTVIDMCDHMATKHGRPWISVIGANRKFSECMLYGAYVDSILKGAGHWGTDVMLCPMCWFDPAPSDEELIKFMNDLTQEQVAFGVQSFIPMDPQKFRELTSGYKPN